MDNEKWQLESLFKRAFERTKERFLSYFLTWVASFGIGIGVLVLIILAALLVGIVYGVTKSVLLAGVLGLVIGIGSCVALIYVSSWTALATISVLISEEKLGVGATFAKVKPFVWGYFWMSFLAGLFMMGLMPWGILSLGVIFVLWSFWSSFMAFAYLKTRKSGLQSLWISRQMFRQNPWGIFGRILLLTVAVWAISFAINLIFGSFGKNGNMASSGISMIFSILYAPFGMSFIYEMFLNLEEPKEEVKAPTVWVVFSILGWAISVLAFVGIIGVIVTQAPLWMQKANELKNFENLDQNQLQQEMMQDPNYQDYQKLIPTFEQQSREMPRF